MTMPLPLIGGSYSARSIIANAQRCVNLFPEVNQKDSITPTTHYQRPGLTLLAPGPGSVGRGIWRASTGAGYCVIGQGVFFITPGFALQQIGKLQVPGTGMCSFVDNGNTGVLVDGSGIGYQIVLASNIFSQIVDPTGTFVGANKVDYADTFMIFNMPGTNEWGCSLSNVVQFNAGYIAAKTGWPDPIVSLAVVRREIYILGQLKSEIWFDAGGSLFPFQELPGSNIEHGCAAVASVANEDLNLYWLAQDLQGQGIVLMATGYTVARISNFALEFAIRGYALISDATAYCYQQDGHTFYVLTFPSANVTWVYDKTTQTWHQRAWTDGNGNLNRERSCCHAFINGKNCTLDWQNGNLYALDLSNYTDNGNQISFIRTFPHIGMGLGSQGQPILANGKRLKFETLTADIECGMVGLDVNGNPPTAWLRWSDDRGRTFGNPIEQTLGQQGQYLTQPVWHNLGIARDRVFEIGYSVNGPAALNGAWVDATVLNT